MRSKCFLYCSHMQLSNAKVIIVLPILVPVGASNGARLGLA
jgi:hypothetical protein